MRSVNGLRPVPTLRDVVLSAECMEKKVFVNPPLEDLSGQIKRLEERYPHLSREERFALWFQSANITNDDEAAASSLTGAPKDKGMDAIHISETAKTVFITQSKYRTGKGTKRNESPNDVLALPQIARALRSTSELYRRFTAELDPLVVDKLTGARERVLKRRYRLVLYYVTTKNQPRITVGGR